MNNKMIIRCALVSLVAPIVVSVGAMEGSRAAWAAPRSATPAAVAPHRTVVNSIGVVNSIMMRNRSGSRIVNYPLQLGRPFLRGAIPHVPQVLANSTPVPTQADIKNRWPDGSVEFAVIAIMIPTLPANGSLTLTFADTAPAANAPLTKAQMLDPRYVFDAMINLVSGGVSKTVDARRMLQNGDYKLWTQGPIAQTIELADDTPARKYDIGFDGFRPFRPRFYATFWPQTHQVQVRFVGENGNSQEIEDLAYNLTLTTGSAAPTQVYAADLAGGGTPLITGMTVNFRFAGLIHLALPNARIIHLRRDPVDTCLSCFAILFGGDQPFTYDLAELGHYYRAYAGLMEHWRRVLPAGVMLEVRYEELVGDFEAQARRILAHCRLDWDEACPDFHQTRRPVHTASAVQVRQPLYQTAIGRRRPPADQLRPLLDALRWG